MGVKLFVYADLHGESVLETTDLEAAIARATVEYQRTGIRAWVLDAEKDIYAYVSEGGVERF